MQNQISSQQQTVCPHLFWPDAQVEVEARLQQQVLDVVWVDREVEIQRVSQQLVGLLVALPVRAGNVIQSQLRIHFFV